jgi:hypothetical protein
MDKGFRLFVGMDVGDRRVALMIKGCLVEESRLATTGTALTRKSAWIEPCRMALGGGEPFALDPPHIAPAGARRGDGRVDEDEQRPIRYRAPDQRRLRSLQRLG